MASPFIMRMLDRWRGAPESPVARDAPNPIDAIVIDEIARALKTAGHGHGTGDHTGLCIPCFSIGYDAGRKSAIRDGAIK